MVLRLIHALFGAVLGAVIAFWFFDEFNWNLISICAGICGVLAFVWGELFLERLKWWE
jgi:MFS family permease